MKFINKSVPILLMPLWWICWLFFLVFHNCYFRVKNEYKKVKPAQRDSVSKKKKEKKKGKKKDETPTKES